MAITTSADLSVLVQLKEVFSSGPQAGMIPTTLQEALELKNGTSDGQINTGVFVRVTGKAASTTTRYDLADGTLLKADGSAATFADVVCIAIRNNRTTAGAYIDIGPSDTDPIASGAAAFWGTTTSRTRVASDAGWVVIYSKVGQAVAGSADAIDIDTSATAGDTNAWDLVILGRAS